MVNEVLTVITDNYIPDKIIHDSFPAGNNPSAKSRTDRHTFKPFSDILGKYSKDLICLIEELKTGNITELSLNLLIKVSYELALVNVRKKISKISNVNKRWNLSTEDLAIESISNLFIRNSKRERLNLECFLSNWTDPIRDDLDALYFLNKIVNISIDQYMNKLFRDTDPYFAKIIDTLYVSIKKLNYSKLDHLGTVYIVKDNLNTSLPASIKIIPAEEFSNICFEHFTKKTDLLSYIMNYIEFNTKYFPAIPINLLVERIIGNNHQVYSLTEVNEFERISIDDIIFSSLERIINKMKRTYLNTNKLTQSEADYLASALTDIAFDFREGKTIEQLSDYLQVYINDFSIELYKNRYRNILEYLVKLFKKSIAGKLRQ